MNDSETIAAPQSEPSELVPTDGRQELDQALASRAFEKAPTLRKLLIYLWEKRGDEVSEYAIATEALRRRADFEPRADATVRVQIARLRSRLKDFYETDGVEFPRRLVIPVGSHQIQIIDAPSVSDGTAAEAELAPEAVKKEGRWRLILRAQTAAIVLLLLACGGVIIERNIAVRRITEGHISSLPPFWRNFLGNGKLTRIVVPTPVFFGFQGRVLARDLNVNDYSHLGDSPMLHRLVTESGGEQPLLAQSYVAAPDALALLHLSQYLDPGGGHLSISTTAESSLDSLEQQNLIVTGTPRTLAPLQPLLDRLSFRVDAERGAVVRKDSGGNVAKYETVQQSAMRMTTPGVIACLPGGPQNTHVLILVTTYHTSALVSYLTSEAGLRELEAASRAHGSPAYFEAVLLSEINGTTELRSRLVEFHALSSGTKAD